MLDASNVDGTCVVELDGGCKGLDVGVEVVQTVDWERRWYHMQAHTSQHLLSAAALKFDVDTHSWDLNDAGLSVDFKGKDVESMVAECERIANMNVAGDVAIKASWLDVESDEFKDTVRSRCVESRPERSEELQWFVLC